MQLNYRNGAGRENLAPFFMLDSFTCNNYIMFDTA